MCSFCASLVVEGSGGKRSAAERVVWERRAPAPAHGARPLSFYTFAHTYLSNAVFYPFSPFLYAKSLIETEYSEIIVHHKQLFRHFQ